jgi:hypothetical protein
MMPHVVLELHGVGLLDGLWQLWDMGGGRYEVRWNNVLQERFDNILKARAFMLAPRAAGS